MEETIKTINKRTLTGEKNYQGWAKVVKAELVVKGYYDPADSKFVVAKSLHAAALILSAVSFEIAGSIAQEEAAEIWDYLLNEYGSTNPWEIKSKLKLLSMGGIEYKPYFMAFNAQLVALANVQGNVTPGDQLDIMLSQIHQGFYLDTIRRTRKAIKSRAVTSIDLKTFIDDVKDEYEATPELVRRSYSESSRRRNKNRINDDANNTDGNDKHCALCDKWKRQKVMKSHNESTCLFGDKEGWSKQSASLANKPDNEYPTDLPVWDPGCTPRSYFKTKPTTNFKVSGGSVGTAGKNSSFPIKGTGTVMLGEIKLDNVAHVPGFKKDLVSGIQLMKMGLKQTLHNDKLIIEKGSQIVATGHYDTTDGLIKIDRSVKLHNQFSVLETEDSNENNSSRREAANGGVTTSQPSKSQTIEAQANATLDYTLLHKSMGHPNEPVIQKTIEASQGDHKLSVKPVIICPDCGLGKAYVGHKCKSASTPITEPMAVIESDTQGPFRINAVDGTKNNVKFLDVATGWLKINTIHNRSSKTILNCFKPWVARMEKQTGCKLKAVRTDGGTEYKGEFLDYLEDTGTKKLLGLPYVHEDPPRCERAHRTILNMARPMLIGSNLPAAYYGEAMMTACYIYNRTVHGTKVKTPYELLFGKQFDLTRLKPFGSICYASIQPEYRGKVGENNGERCRFLGYGDDDELEEVKGYRLLRESDLEIIYTPWNHVQFDLQNPMIPLPNHVNDDDEYDDVFADPTFQIVGLEGEENEYQDDFLNNSNTLQNEHGNQDNLQNSEQTNDEEEVPNSVNEDDGNQEEEEPTVYEDAASNNNNDNDTTTNEEDEPNSGGSIVNDPGSETDSYNSAPTDDHSSDEDFALLSEDLNSSDFKSANNALAALALDVELEDGDEINNLIDEVAESFKDAAYNVGMEVDDLCHAFLAMTEGIPVDHKSALASKAAPFWIEAMDKEVLSQKNAKVGELQELPKGKKVIGGRWVFRIKLKMDGSVDKYKARWCAKGYTQKEGIDFTETFAPVAKFKSVRILMAICAILKMTAYQDDVPVAFLNGVLSEELYMDQIQGYEDGTNRKVRMRKTIYGLKQSPREWNAVMDTYLRSQGFKPSIADPCMYSKRVGKELTIIALYVDDIITAGTNETEVQRVRSHMHNHFHMDAGNQLSWYLGMHFYQSKDHQISIDQNQYIQQKLAEFHDHIGPGGSSTPLPTDFLTQLEENKESKITMPDFPFRQMLGSIMYAMLGTRPDLAVAVSVLSRYMSNPMEIHCQLLRHLYKYVRANPTLSLIYKPGSSVTLVAYADASYANAEECKSLSGYVTVLASGPISWFCGRQPVVAQSSCESEYISAVLCGNEIVWLCQLLLDLGFPQKCIILYEDNQACIALSKNPQDHKRTKHIQVRFHVLRQYVQNKVLSLVYCRTASQLADMFTKALPGHMLRELLRQLGTSTIASPGGSRIDVI
jgi:hypothetical protein